MSRDIIRLDGLPRPRGAESLGLRAGSLVFIIGIGGRPGAGAAELESAVEHAARVLDALGSGLERVAKTKLSLRDWSAFPAIDAAYDAVFAAFCPARACVGAGLLDPQAGLSLEILAGTDAAPRAIGMPAAGEALQQVWGTRLGDLIFSNGLIATDAPELASQAGALLADLAAGLGAAGAGADHVVKINGTTASWHGFGAYNAAYAQLFAEPFAARASVQGTLPDVAALLGIEAIASLTPDRCTIDAAVAGPWHPVARRLHPDLILSTALHPPKGPHSHGVRAGSLIFVAGACPYDAADRLIAPGDIAAQTRTTLDNVQHIVEALGAGMDDIVKTNVTLADGRLFASFDAAYADYFTAPYPARQVVAAGLGQAGMLVEIEAIACLGARRTATALIGSGA